MCTFLTLKKGFCLINNELKNSHQLKELLNRFVTID